MQISKNLHIADPELQLRFITSSGPGGQNVNKVSTAVHLSFNLNQSSSISEEVKSRVRSIAGKRVTADGIINIKAQRFRSQERNKIDALNRFISLIRLGLESPKIRYFSGPSYKSRQQRMDSKRNQSIKKALRAKIKVDK